MLRFFIPGVSGLFRYGRWSFLAVALTFFVSLDLLLISHLFWTDCLTPQGWYFSFVVFAIVWFLLANISVYCERILLNRRDADSKRNFFSDAITQYLQGNWYDAERYLNEILQRNPRDPEALLMLATLFRHTGRTEESRQTLHNLQKFEEARKWFVEIETELTYLASSDIPNDKS